MTWMGITFYYFSLLLGLIGASVALGHGLRRLALGRPLGFGYTQLLFDGLTGAVGLATGAALWWTRSVTIHLTVLLIAAFFLVEVWQAKGAPRQAEPAPEPLPWRSAWPALLGALLIFGFCAWGFVRPGAFVPFSIPNNQATVHHDHINYARVAYFLTVSGEETDTFFLNLLDTAYQGVKPYHYLELWLTNAVTGITGTHQVVVLYLVIYPFFYWLTLIGILALWEGAGSPPSGWRWPIALLLLFVGGFTFEVYKEVGFLALLSTYKHAAMSGLAKLATIYVFLLASVRLVQQRQFLFAWITLLLLGTASSVVFPAIALATCTAALGAVGFGWLPRLVAWRALGYALAFGLAVAAFYHFFDTSTVGREGASAKSVGSLVMSLVDYSTLRTRFNIIVGTMIQLAIVYAPFLLVVLMFWSDWWRAVAKPYWGLLLFVLLLLLAGTVAWTVFYKQLNSSQLFYNLAVPLCNVLVFALAVWVIQQRTTWRSWVAAGVFLASAVLLFWESLSEYPLKNIPVYYSDTYLQQVDTYLATQPGGWLAGASLKTGSAYYDVFQKYVTIYTNGSYLAYLGNGGAATISLNDLEIPLADDPFVRAREQQAISMGLFYRWVAREKAAGTFRDVPTSQRDFVQHYKLKFLIISRGVDVPATLKSLVKAQFTDSVSGEQFLILDLAKATSSSTLSLPK